MRGRKLERLRKKYWGTQQALADEIGIHRTALSHWENNILPIPIYIELLIEKLVEEKKNGMS